MVKSLRRRLAGPFSFHKLLQALDQHGRFRSQEEWAKAAGLHPGTVSRALQREDFLSLYRNALLRRATTRLPAVLDAAIDVASRPEHTSHADRRMLLEMTGLYTPKSKQEVSGSMQLDFASLVQGIHAEPPIDTTARELPPGDDEGVE